MQYSHVFKTTMFSLSLQMFFPIILHFLLLQFYSDRLLQYI